MSDGEVRRRRPVVAIDGPAGVGKSTTARRLAEQLGFTYVDTGALYRAVALEARERGVSWDDEEGLGDLAAGLRIELKEGASGGAVLIVDGRDRTEAIRRPEISIGASKVSRFRSVRQALLELQRRLGREGGVVLEGRDIGTVVFPDAEVKVFLTARPEVRARRRHAELLRRGESVPFDQVLAEIVARDEQDSTRKVAPLRRAEDAVEIDSSELSIEQVVDRIAAMVRGGAASSRRRG